MPSAESRLSRPRAGRLLTVILSFAAAGVARGQDVPAVPNVPQEEAQEYRALPPAQRYGTLLDLYADNVARVRRAADYCAARGIRLYRLSSSLFPMLDLDGDDTGAQVLAHLAPQLRDAGHAFQDHGIRVLMHPEQFIVLNSDRPEVRASSLRAITTHAQVMDALNLERSTWNLLLLHGGKGARAQELQAIIPDLPDAVRLRLGLENDERAYSPRDLLPVCDKTQPIAPVGARRALPGVALEERPAQQAQVLRIVGQAVAGAVFDRRLSPRAQR